MNIGEKIKKLQTENNIKTYKLSQLTGIPNSTLVDIIKGKTEKIAIDYLFKISSVFGVDVEYLISNDKSTIDQAIDLSSPYLKKYRELDETSLDLVNRLIDFEYEQTQRRATEKTETFNLTEEEKDFMMKFREIKEVDVRVLSRMLDSMYERKDRERASSTHTDGKEA